MAIKRRASKPESTSTIEYENLPEGEHEGRLAYVADLGLHTNEYKGEAKDDVQKLALGIEVVGSSVTIDGEEHPRLLWCDPFNIYFTMTDKGKEVLLYQVFDPDAVAGVEADWDAVIGTPCNLKVVHRKGKGDKKDEVYDNVAGITPIPAKYQDGVAAARITDGCTGDCEDANNPAQKALFGLAKWQFDQRIVEGAEDAPEKEAPKVVPEKEEELFESPSADEGDGPDWDDDIPF